MAQPTPNRFYPHRWTLLTWLAVLAWAWQGAVFNIPVFESFTVDPATGELSEPIHYQQLSDLPYPVGWPLHYVKPDDLSAAMAKPWLAGMPPPVPGPSTIRPLALTANVALIVAAIAALVYCLQKSAYRYRMWVMLAVLSALPLYFAGARLAVLIGGRAAGQGWPIAVYFAPVPLAFAARHSPLERFGWPRTGRQQEPG